MVSVAFRPTPTTSTMEEGTLTRTLYGNPKRAQERNRPQVRPIIFCRRVGGKHIILRRASRWFYGRCVTPVIGFVRFTEEACWRVPMSGGRRSVSG